MSSSRIHQRLHHNAANLTYILLRQIKVLLTEQVVGKEGL